MSSIGNRMDVVSARLVGRPYQAFPLIGSAEAPEVFTAAMKGFDCVTFIETVLALSRSRSDREFREALKKIRYHDGKIDWLQRNHYMTAWIRNNIRDGWIRRIPGLPADVRKDRVLSTLEGYPPFRMKFSCVRKNELLRRSDRLQTGDLAFFASTRAHLDIFHCGLLVLSSEGLVLRHASRSRGAVVEQQLKDFLKQNRMAGVIVVRPAEEP